MKKFFLLITIIFLCIGLISTLCEAKTTKSKSAKTTTKKKTTQPAKAKEIKAGFVYIEQIGDNGWTFAHDEGRKALEKIGVKTAYVESVPEGAEAEKVITQFASAGYDIIFATSPVYTDTVIEIAQKFPNVIFGVCAGNKSSTNVFTYYARMYQPMYLNGIIAGKMTKTNKIGYVAPQPVPEWIRNINASTLGARTVNPSANVYVAWIGSSLDPEHEKESAIALIDAGCDIIITAGGSPSALQIAESKEIFSIGYNSDNRSYAPKYCLTSAIWDWAVIYKDAIGRLKKGFKGWQRLDYLDGMEFGTVKLAPFNDLVPKNIQKMINEKADLYKEEDNVFAGPIKDQNGELKVKKGAILTDEEMNNMTWFVEGVVGTIPQK